MTKLTQRPEIPTDIKEIATDGGIAVLILAIKHIVANLSDTESQSLQALFSSMEGCSNFFFSATVLRIIDL